MRNSEVLVEVRSFDFRTKPNDNLLLHLDSELDVPYMFFDHLDERNAMVKSVSHFDNFPKWTILVVNICPLFLGE
jgi:hypothetical protein